MKEKKSKFMLKTLLFHLEPGTMILERLLRLS